MRLHAIYRTDAPPGPAGSWLIARFEAQATAAAEAADHTLSAPYRPTGAKDR
jgi:hypothetical protein